MSVAIRLTTATHIYAQPGLVTVSEAEAARLCSIGVAQVVEAEAKEAPKKPAIKKTNKKAAK